MQKLTAKLEGGYGNALTKAKAYREGFLVLNLNPKTNNLKREQLVYSEPIKPLFDRVVEYINLFSATPRLLFELEFVANCDV